MCLEGVSWAEAVTSWSLIVTMSFLGNQEVTGQEIVGHVNAHKTKNVVFTCRFLYGWNKKDVAC